jgi:hypothetical protein
MKVRRRSFRPSQAWPVRRHGGLFRLGWGNKCNVPAGMPTGGDVYVCNALGRDARYRTYCTNSSMVDDSKLPDSQRKRGISQAADTKGAEGSSPALAPGFWVKRPVCGTDRRPEMLVSMRNRLKFQHPNTHDPTIIDDYGPLPEHLVPKPAAIPPPRFLERFRSPPPLYSGAREYSLANPDEYRFVDLGSSQRTIRLAGRAQPIIRPYFYIPPLA